MTGGNLSTPATVTSTGTTQNPAWLDQILAMTPVTAGTTTPTTMPTTTTPFTPTITQPDPMALGNDVAAYYRNALANDPRMAGINQNLSGTISPEVKALLAQTAAERGVSIGSVGSSNAETALLRAMGLTSMGLTNQGITQYGEAQRGVPSLNPSDLFVSPNVQAQTQTTLEAQSRDQAAQMQRLQTQIQATSQLQASEQGAAMQRLQAQILATSNLSQQEQTAAMDRLRVQIASAESLAGQERDAAMQRLREQLSSQAQLQANQLNQQQGQFNTVQANNQAGNAATNAVISQILGQSGGGSSGGSYLNSPITGGSMFAQGPNVTSGGGNVVVGGGNPAGSYGNNLFGGSSGGSSGSIWDQIWNEFDQAHNPLGPDWTTVDYSGYDPYSFNYGG